MKTFTIAAAIAVASVSVFTIAPAVAQGSAARTARGHYEWYQAPPYGPQAPAQAPRRIWVPDGAQVASCDCGMMNRAALTPPSA
jgi:hypothetical protein